MFTDATKEDIAKVAEEFGLEAAVMLAVVEIESGGSVFADVDGRQEPLIRFEGHYFDRRLSGDAQAIARTAGLASPDAGAIANPVSQAARWRLLERAAAIDRKAAHESVSWGLGQVMGAHWSWLGFADVDAMVAEARSGTAGQVRLMARFIDKSGLRDALDRHDWDAFAHGYNGPGYRRNAYHTKLAAAYRRHKSPGTLAAQQGGSDTTTELLGLESSGEPVRELQRALSALGYPLRADGSFGRDTEAAVKTFQRDHGLPADGIVGPRTREAIAKTLPFGSAGGGWWRDGWRWMTGWFGRP
jgi:hypothetical protein